MDYSHSGAIEDGHAAVVNAGASPQYFAKTSDDKLTPCMVRALGMSALPLDLMLSTSL
jgi:hypothetical protein